MSEREEPDMSDHSVFGSQRGRLRRRGFLAGLAGISVGLIAACSSGDSTGSTDASSSPSAAPTSGSSAPTANGTVVKTTNDNKFDPATVTIAKGGTVTWTNSSGMMHSVTDDPAKASNKADAQLPPGAQSWDSGMLQANQSYSHTFDVAGTYKYFCAPHESLGMVGTVIVQ